MQSAMLDPSRPPMWVIEPNAQEPAGDILRFGHHEVALSDIASVSAEEVRDRPIDGILMGGVVFIAIACALAYGVFDAEMRTRFLLGTVLLGCLGFIGLFETASIKGQSFFQVRLILRSGRSVVFSSADQADVARLIDRINAKS